MTAYIEGLINKQFEMIGVNFRWKDILEDGMILVNKKKKEWYNYYKFENIEQYEEWKKYVLDCLRGSEKEANRLDFEWGMTYKNKREENSSLLF